MTKYSPYSRRPVFVRPWTIHPVWGGIGCVLMLLIPVMAYAGAALLVQENLARRWLPVPALFARPVILPLVGGIPYLLANLAVAVVLALAGFALLTALYSLVYRLAGPDRYGPTDAPPERSRRRR